MRKTYLYCILLLVCISMLPSTLAASISEVELTYNNHPVRYVGEGKTITPVAVSFTVASASQCRPFGNQYCYVRPRLNELNPSGSSPSDLSLERCAINQTEESFACAFEGLAVNPTSETIPYTLILLAQIELTRTSGTFTVVRDATIPTLQRLETGSCAGEGSARTCYVGSGTQALVRAVYSDDVGAFDYGLVAFEITGSGGTSVPGIAQCTGRTCEAIIETHLCEQGQDLHLRVSQYAQGVPSMEDAFNPLPLDTQGIRVYCSATAPELTSLQLSSSATPSSLFTTQSTNIFTATLTDALPGTLRAQVQIDDQQYLHNFSCSAQATGEHRCTGSLPALTQGEHTLHFRFLNGAGNQVTQTKTIQVHEVTQNSAGNGAINGGSSGSAGQGVVAASITQVTPNPINRVALDLARKNTINYPILVDYALARTSGSATVVHQSLDDLSCEWGAAPEVLGTQDASTTALFSIPRSYILNPSADAGESNRFVLNFNVLAENLPETVYARCEYDIFLMENDVVYATPERETFELTLHFANSILGSPGQEFLDEIAKAEAKLDGPFDKAVEKLQEVGSIADKVCGVYGTLNVITGIGSGVEVAGSVLPPVIGEGVMAAGNAIRIPSELVLDLVFPETLDLTEASAELTANGGQPTELSNAASKTQLESRTPFSLRNLCDGWMCSGAENANKLLNGGSLTSGENNPLSCSNINDWLTDEQRLGTTGLAGDPNIEGEGKYCAPNYKDSLLASFGLTGGPFCAKGVLYNFGKLQAIDCGYVSCLKEQSLHGANVDVCKQARDFKLCTQAYGEIFELPIVNVVSRSSALINSQIQNSPLEILRGGVNLACTPGKEAIEQFKQQVIRSALDAATNGAFSAVENVLALLSRFQTVLTAAPAVDAAVTATPTTRATLPKLICDVSKSVFRAGDYAQLLSGQTTLQMNFEENLAICEQARCDGPNCLRAGYEPGWLDNAAVHALLFTEARTEQDIAPEVRRKAQALGKLEEAARTQAVVAEVTRRVESEMGSGTVDSALVEQVVQDAANYRVSAQREFERTGVAPAPLDEGTLISSGEYGRPYARALVGLTQDDLVEVGDVSIDITDTDALSSYGLSEREIASIQGTLAPDDGGSVQLDVIQNTKERLAQCRSEACASDNPQEVSQGLAQTTAPAQEVTFNTLTESLQANNPDVASALTAYKETLDTRASFRESQIKRDELAAVCNQPGNGVSCTVIDSGIFKNELQICDEQGNNCRVPRGTESTQRKMMDEELEALANTLSFFVSKWVLDKGYLDDLKLSNFGSWGRETARNAEKLWSPDSWKQNLCSAEMDILIDDEPLMALGSSQGNALTFAIEKIQTPRQGVDDTFVYTLSYFIRSDYEADDNTVRFILQPGNVELVDQTTQDTSSTSGEDLPAGSRLQNAFSWSDTREFSEFCIAFSSEFPNYLGERTYCRPIVANAFNRGDTLQGEVNIFE